MTKCSVCILTYNNEGTLERALESVRDFAEIILLDGGSTDKTLEIAKKFNAKIFSQNTTGGKIEDFTAIRSKLFGLANENWILWLDSDEWLSQETVGDIQSIIDNDRVGLYSFIRKAVIGKKIIEHAYFYPEYCKRFWKKDSDVELKKGKRVHEALIAPKDIKEYDLKSVIFHSWWEKYKDLIQKDNYYLDLTIRGKEDFSRYKKLRVAYINILKAIKVFFKSFFIYLRYGFNNSLPVSYSWRFVRYHLVYAKKVLFI